MGTLPATSNVVADTVAPATDRPSVPYTVPVILGCARAGSCVLGSRSVARLW